MGQTYRFSILNYLIVQLIKIYQCLVSPFLSGHCCRFYPSCSSYTIDAINHYGCLRGLFLSIRRILRCHPFHPGGFDPIPKRDQS